MVWSGLEVLAWNRSTGVATGGHLPRALCHLVMKREGGGGEGPTVPGEVRPAELQA